MSKHHFTHIELSAADRKASADFYARVFGWEARHMDDMNYSMLDTGHEGLGVGLNPVTAESPAGTVLIYVSTDDLDDTLTKVEAAGGAVLMPKYEIPTVGWMAIFQDISGNNLALMQWMPQAE